ncbi:hypothetical protein B0H67DRAFT_554902 [Lasiosphaeris hirsuta]|uniref:Uncharacterized protein n=1 Tax=Lasiosphaeris hirsuta TaxID=260670 RepID=A0AA40A7U3_9PEZI|nr:hypothetical protein B0H67DRAFT_554902 [Lasiosphaeris hirsuta]
MLDENLGWLPEDKLDPTCPPPPYASYLGSGDDSEKKKPPSALHAVQRNATEAQQQGKGSKGSTSIWGRVLCRIISGVSRHPKNEIYPTTATAAAVAAAAAAAAVKRDRQPNVSEGLPRWVGHNGMTCGHGATSTKRTLPLAPPPCATKSHWLGSPRTRFHQRLKARASHQHESNVHKNYDPRRSPPTHPPAERLTPA